VFFVGLKRATTGAAMAAVHAAAGASVMKAFNLVDNLQLVKLPPGIDVKQALQHYAHNPHANVLYAEPNWIVEAVATPNDPNFGSLWGLKNTGISGGVLGADIDAENAWNLTTGDSSVVVAVIDTGIDYTHLDLAANTFSNNLECSGTPSSDDDYNGYVDDCHGYDFVNNDGNPVDDHNHGTHVAGTIGAVGNNGLGVVGVNWNVKIMACKFLNASGSGSTAGAISCMDYVKTMKGRDVNIVATNNSWGGGGFSQSLLDAITAHRDLGILFIAAAGNSSSNNDSGNYYPANYDAANLIAVAATTRTDAKASFSSYGRHSVHLGAPGEQILSTTRNNTYSTFNGTSMATPHVTGVAALVKAGVPSADWIEIKNRILAGSENIASMAGTTITGKRLNAYGALTCSDSDVVLARLRPTQSTVVGSAGTPIPLKAMHINCTGSIDLLVDVEVSTGEVVTLVDPEGDGIYSGQWTPPDGSNYALTFPNGDVVQVNGSPPSLSVTPLSLVFGNVTVGSSKDMSFTMTNSGGGTLAGSASTSAPFSIISGSPFSLIAGASQSVTVRFSPTSAAPFSDDVAFTSNGGDTTRAVSGTGVSLGSITVTAPDGGESWRIGSNKPITWTSIGISGNVKIDISRDFAGTSWTTIFSSTANDGKQMWKVKSPTTTTARIRICSVTTPTVCDTSNANFTIQ
jgi:subtilisin family serine protease